MADPLRESIQQRNQMIGASLPYRAVNGAESFLQGAQQVQGIQARAQEMELRAANEEREKAMYGEKILAMHAELDLRQKQAATQALEAQTALARAQNDQTRLQLDKQQADRPIGAIVSAIEDNPYRLNSKGLVDHFALGPDGKYTLQTDLPVNDPGYLRWREGQTLNEDVKRSEIDRNKSYATWNNQRGSTGKTTTRDVQTLQKLYDDHAAKLNKMRGGMAFPEPTQAEIDAEQATVDSLGSLLESAKGSLGETLGAPAPERPTSQNGTPTESSDFMGIGKFVREGVSKIAEDVKRRSSMTFGQRTVEDVLRDPNNAAIVGAINYTSQDLGFDSPQQVVEMFGKMVEAYIDPQDRSGQQITAAQLLFNWLRSAHSEDPHVREAAIKTAHRLMGEK